MNTSHKEIDLAHPKANSKNTGFLPVERAWIDKFLSYGYIDTFRHLNQEAGHYTWWTYRMDARKRNIGWRLDYFFVNKEFLPRIQDAGILSNVHGSDHCPVFLEITDKNS
jgi:exodeoxyribonuclease-3